MFAAASSADGAAEEVGLLATVSGAVGAAEEVGLLAAASGAEGVEEEGGLLAAASGAVIGEEEGPLAATPGDLGPGDLGPEGEGLPEDSAPCESELRLLPIGLTSKRASLPLLLTLLPPLRDGSCENCDCCCHAVAAAV